MQIGKCDNFFFVRKTTRRRRSGGPPRVESSGCDALRGPG
uniref:Uncharacterized protein n=1 Tax=Anguilla anguilla TaxID=7936 RepID=A0A0E9TLX2_ANGAN